MLDTVVTDDGVECVLCVPRGRARQQARAASSVRGRAVRGGPPCVRFTVARCSRWPATATRHPAGCVCVCRRRMRREAVHYCMSAMKIGYVCIVLFGLANGAKVSLVSGTYLSHLV